MCLPLSPPSPLVLSEPPLIVQYPAFDDWGSTAGNIEGTELKTIRFFLYIVIKDPSHVYMIIIFTALHGEQKQQHLSILTSQQIWKKVVEQYMHKTIFFLFLLKETGVLQFFFVVRLAQGIWDWALSLLEHILLSMHILLMQRTI